MKNRLVFFDVIPSWIIILMPILLISGPFLSDLGLSIVTILFLINSVKNKLKKYYDNIYFKFFLIFCLILILSSLLSNNVLISGLIESQYSDLTKKAIQVHKIHRIPSVKIAIDCFEYRSRDKMFFEIFFMKLFIRIKLQIINFYELCHLKYF